MNHPLPRLTPPPAMSAEAEHWLQNYQGNFEFYISLQNQYRNGRALSERQIAAVERAVAREKQAVEPIERVTYAPGTAVLLGQTFSRRMAKELNLSYVYRAIEIVETLRETERAIQVRFKYTPRFKTICGACGAELDNDISRATGIGPVCAKNLGIKRYNMDRAQEIVTEIEGKLKDAGEMVHWIPRWAFKSEIEPEAVPS